MAFHCHSNKTPEGSNLNCLCGCCQSQSLPVAAVLFKTVSLPYTEDKQTKPCTIPKKCSGYNNKTLEIQKPSNNQHNHKIAQYKKLWKTSMNKSN